MVFEHDNLQTESLGEYLRQIRESKGLDIRNVATECGIPEKALKLLENGEFQHLPADVYVMGFLKKISVYYGIQSGVLVEQYKRERKVELPEEIRNKTPLGTGRMFISVTPKMLSFILGAVLIIATLIWLVWQVFQINTSPELEIYEPKPGTVVKESVVRVKGKTDPGTNLNINKEKVFVDKDGLFYAELSLSSGQKDLVFESENKFKKKATETLSIIVDIPENSGGSKDQTAESELLVEISVKKDLNISLTVDDIVLETKKVTQVEPLKITAKQKIVLLTSDAGNTFVKVNGKDLGALGRVGETLTVPFTKDTINIITK